MPVIHKANAGRFIMPVHWLKRYQMAQLLLKHLDLSYINIYISNQ